jgi:succinate dehydrogenase hydrophobic anchor subunit
MVTYAKVQERIHSSIFLVDLLLLYVGLFHGLYGLRNVLTDIVPKLHGRLLTAALVAIGLGLSCYGTHTLTALL